MDLTDIYDCPIEQQVDQLQVMMANEHDRQIVKAVQRIGIEIDQEGLIEAINNDRQRYEAAYKRGYEAAREEFEGKYQRPEDSDSVVKTVKINNLTELRRYLAGFSGDVKTVSAIGGPITLTTNPDDRDVISFI